MSSLASTARLARARKKLSASQVKLWIPDLEPDFGRWADSEAQVIASFSAYVDGVPTSS